MSPRKVLFVSLAVSLLDILTTYINVVLYSTCVFERNAAIRSLCAASPALVFAWVPVEAAVIFCVAYAVQLLRARLAVKLRVECIFLVLTLSPAVNNAAQLLRVLR